VRRDHPATVRRMAPSPATPATLVIAHGDVVTVDADRRVLADGAVAVAAGAIVAVGFAPDVLADHPDAEVLDATGCVVTPGLVDAHQHLTCDPLVRSLIPDDIQSDTAIFDWAVPLHAHQTARDDELAALLCSVEALENGVTTLIDAGTVAHPIEVAQSMRAAGIRGGVGVWGWDLVPDGPLAGPAPEVLARLRDHLDALPPDGVVAGWVSLVGHDLVSDELLVGAAGLARERGAQRTWHISPHDRDAAAYLARTGRRPIEHYADLGILGRDVLLAHAVHLDGAEVDLVLEHEVAVASCPWAYLRLAQGYAAAGRHVELVRRGGRVALGCDAHNAADGLDVLRAAALLCGLGKDVAVDPTAIDAPTAFELATRRGAEAVGLGGVVGSLEVGRRADVVVHDGRRIQWTPIGDHPTHLVFGTDGRTVRDVLVDGHVVVRGGWCTTVDVDALRDEAAAAARALLARAGIAPQPRWPVLRREA
jgi:5-methylthioadenosine/S-adenosylhomocysteine deaminase